MRYDKTRQLVIQALIAAVYAAVSLALPALSFGAVQIRFAEALTLLPVISGPYIWGVTLGCFLTNLIGAFMGVNILGVIDVAVGTAATLVAAVLSYWLRNVRVAGTPVASALSPVLLNGVAIGLELSYVTTGSINMAALLACGGSVALGEFVSCAALGLPMIYFLEERGWDKQLR